MLKKYNNVTSYYSKLTAQINLFKNRIYKITRNIASY